MDGSGEQAPRRFHVAGGPARLRSAAVRAADVAVAFGVAAQRHDDVELAVHEALANAVEHGHRGRDELPVDVEVCRDGVARVVVRITDRAVDGRMGSAGRRSPDRGNGRTLMQAGTDHLRTTAAAGATTVELGWEVVSDPVRSGVVRADRWDPTR